MCHQLYREMWASQTADVSYSSPAHTEKYFLNLVELTRNQIVFTIFRLIWIQTGFRLDPNQSENGKYNLISGWFNNIWNYFSVSTCKQRLIYAVCLLRSAKQTQSRLESRGRLACMLLCPDFVAAVGTKI